MANQGRSLQLQVHLVADLQRTAFVGSLPEKSHLGGDCPSGAADLRESTQIPAIGHRGSDRVLSAGGDPGGLRCGLLHPE